MGGLRLVRGVYLSRGTDSVGWHCSCSRGQEGLQWGW